MAPGARSLGAALQNLNMHDHAEAKADPNEEGLMLKVQILVEHSPWLKGMILSERGLAQIDWIPVKQLRVKVETVPK
jgi:hypothetical protein